MGFIITGVGSLSPYFIFKIINFNNKFCACVIASDILIAPLVVMCGISKSGKEMTKVMSPEKLQIELEKIKPNQKFI